MQSSFATTYQLVEEIASDLNIKITTIDTVNKDFNGDNFLGSVCQVKLIGKKNEKKQIFHLFSKISPKNIIMRCFMDIHNHYVVETYCYEHILPAFSNLLQFYNIPKDECFKRPKFYKSLLEDQEETIILSDVSVREYVMCDRRKPLDYSHVTMVIKNLARLHACSFVLKETNFKQYEEFSSKIGNQYNYGQRFIEVQKKSIRVVSEYIESDKNKFLIKKRLLDNLDEKYKNYFNAKIVHPHSVICHGDPWINNLLFKYQDEEVSKMIFVDWQFCRLASPITDIAYFICLSTDKNFRDEHLDEIFNIYYQTLATAVTKMGQDIQKCFPKTIFYQQIKEYFQFGLAIGMVALPVFLGEPNEIQSLEEVLNDFDTGTHSMNLNDVALKRINDLVVDFIARKLI